MICPFEMERKSCYQKIVYNVARRPIKTIIQNLNIGVTLKMPFSRIIALG
jgi:hypothetical protein